MAQNYYGGLENGILQCLPPRIIHDTKSKDQFGVGVLQQRWHGIKSPPGHPQRRRCHWTWGSSGPGVQPVLLGSGPKCCGTGVFLPRTAGIDYWPTDGAKNVVKKIDEKLEKKKKKKKEDGLWCSQEIFLPKEWTY